MNGRDVDVLCADVAAIRIDDDEFPKGIASLVAH